MYTHRTFRPRISFGIRFNNLKRYNGAHSSSTYNGRLRRATYFTNVWVHSEPRLTYWTVWTPTVYQYKMNTVFCQKYHGNYFLCGIHYLLEAKSLGKSRDVFDLAEPSECQTCIQSRYGRVDGGYGEVCPRTRPRAVAPGTGRILRTTNLDTKIIWRTKTNKNHSFFFFYVIIKDVSSTVYLGGDGRGYDT